MRRQIRVVNKVMIKAIKRIKMRTNATILPILNPNRQLWLADQQDACSSLDELLRRIGLHGYAALW